MRASFDNFKALDIGHFEVQERVMRVVISPNGATKTRSVMSSAARRVAPASLSRKTSVTGASSEIARRGVRRKFQTPSVFGTDGARESGSGLFRTGLESSGGVWQRRPAPAAAGNGDAAKARCSTIRLSAAAGRRRNSSATVSGRRSKSACCS